MLGAVHGGGAVPLTKGLGMNRVNQVPISERSGRIAANAGGHERIDRRSPISSKDTTDG